MTFVELKRRKVLGRVPGHTKDILSVAISGNGSVAVSGAADGTAKAYFHRTIVALLDHKDRAASPRWASVSIGAVAVSDDGTLAATGSSDGAIRLFDLTTFDPSLEWLDILPATS